MLNVRSSLATVSAHMRMRTTIAQVLITLLPLLVACASSGPGKEPRTPAVPEFDGNSLTRALIVADATHRNVLIEYSSESCPFSGKMSERTLTDPDVKDGLREVVYVQVRKGRNSRAFEARWGERKTPTYLVLRPDGSEAGSIVTGLISTKDFVRYVARYAVLRWLAGTLAGNE